MVLHRVVIHLDVLCSPEYLMSFHDCELAAEGQCHVGCDRHTAALGTPLLVSAHLCCRVFKFHLGNNI